MDRVYRCFKLIFVAVLIWVGVEAALTLQATRATEAALPVTIAAQLQPLRAAVIDKLAEIKIPDVQPTLDAAKAKIDAVKLPDVQPTLDAVKAKVEAVEIQATLNEATATIKDAHDSWDDLYWDLNALVQNATVASHGVAVTADVIAQAAPQMVKTAQVGEAQVAGIATDVHTATTEFTRPKTLKEKAWDGVKAVGWLLRFL